VPWMTRSASARSSTPQSRTGRHGRSQKPTPPLGCVIGHRSPRCNCATTSFTAPRSENCYPWPDALDLPVFAWGPLAEGRLTGKYLNGHTGRATKAGRPYTRVGSDDIVRDVVAIAHEIGCSPAQLAISWVRQQPGSVIPLIAARTEEQFRENLAATDVHLSPQHLDRLDALSRPTLGFPADVMREASVVDGVYGAQLPDIDDPRAQAVRGTTVAHP
jgi:diketogulonate reductase-like aldo/keto reductase